MSGLLPIVELLADAQSHGERALWLFQCPDGVIHREHMQIRLLLQRAGLIAGVAYLEARLASINARRLATGHLPPTVIMPIYIAASELKMAARADMGGAASEP